jgi:hypothetical protein
MGWFADRKEKQALGDFYAEDRKRLLASKDEYAKVIFRAFGMTDEKWLTPLGLQRSPGETVRQYCQRAETRFKPDGKALYDFSNIVEEARYSDRVMTEEDRNRCINAFRAFAYSIEPYRLPPEQRAAKLAEMADRMKQRPSEPTKRPWVIAPPLTPPESWRAVPRYSELGRDERAIAGLYQAIGPKKPAPSSLPAELFDEMKSSVAGYKWARLGDLVEGQLDGPAGKCRLFVDGSFPRYMLEFGRRLKASGKVGTDPPWDAHLKWLAAAQVLAMAEVRDYLVPDDLKVAMLLGPVLQSFRVSGPDALAVLDGVPVPVPEP